MNRVVILSVVTALCLTRAVYAQQDIAAIAPTTIDMDGDGILNEQDACPTVAGITDDNPRKSGCTPEALAKRWIMTFMERYAPPGRKTYYNEASETKDEAEDRYVSIANDLIETIYNSDTKPLFAGPAGRSQTVSILLGVMFWETSFRKDVDLGIGTHSRGDNGESWCLMQLKIGDGRTADWNTRLNRTALPNDPLEDVRQGYTGEELVHDRKLCFSEGLKVVRGSFGVCHDLPLNERLSSYASGSCDKGREASKLRMNTGIQWFYNHPRLFKDADLLDLGHYQAQEDEQKPGMLAQTP